MSKIEVGRIVKGKVTGIQPYGAFVALDGEIQGLVHISEISREFVRDIHDYVKVGDEVTVKVLAVDKEAKRASLSMRAVETTESSQKGKRQAKVKAALETATGFHILREKLQEWIEQSKREDLLNK
ncbi:S1 domain-containing post-transcriptional regulator GSP13 [Thermaerobacillus caldiproteolyticus]|uniref:General stress protein 13 n=1 Tax=Thermaerobacillus caldiproteolyticus TaxID=247480 RepID=A0A7W0C0G0_9BACL|nr:S1 domain-containing post-transcriptional regulator GSP13 [Anoxybacillus caldiproteolyticus]MBA2875591.1 general stress protein 13 [Anoxybacillus caldiproteolyticus]QPA30513.1 general stress protein 13 [Anoxybacillus caldiproteolyticus]